MRLWKVLGLAGLAGVAATGVVIVRSERRRRAYTPDQIRDRLHSRVAAAAAEPEPAPPPTRLELLQTSWQAVRARVDRLRDQRQLR